MKKKIYSIVVFIILFFSALSGQERSEVFKVRKLPFNTVSHSEISPVMIHNGLLFCSNRKAKAFFNKLSFKNDLLYNIWYSFRKDSLKWKKPRLVVSERNIHFNNGPMSVDSTGTVIYFTSEVETGKKTKQRNYKNHNGIFIAKLSEAFKITSIEPFAYNSTEYDVAHPSLSRDGKYLYFASDMPGGFGGSDIYYCEYIDGKWSKPINAGTSVNTQYAEIYPFIHPSGKLYFTSDRGDGFGKLDIYYSVKRNMEWCEPRIMPKPVNSSRDDFAYILSDDMSTGYMSSSRTGMDDIYEVIALTMRKSPCDELYINNYCYVFEEANASKYDTIPFEYIWNFGDGDTAIGNIVEHCYPGPGDYTIQLDAKNLLTGETLYNRKSYHLPLEKYKQPYITSVDTCKVGQTVEFSAVETYLPGWEIVRYYWNFDDGTVKTGLKADKEFEYPGIYDVQLIVTAKPGPGGEEREACVYKTIVVQ